MGEALKRLKIIRKEKGSSQQLAADTIGITAQRYHNYENLITEPDLNSLIDIAKYFDVTIDYLLGISDLRFVPSEQEMHLLKLINELPAKDRSMLADLGVEDILYLRLIHDLPQEHKTFLLNLTPADVDMVRYLQNLTDQPKPYVVQGRLVGLPCELPEKDIEELKSFLDFLVERNRKETK